MRFHRLLATVGLVLASAGATVAQTPASKMMAQKGWLTDLDAAKAQARKTGKPLMVVFRCDP